VSWIAFLESHGFERRKPTLPGVGLEGTQLWYRGDLRLLIAEHAADGGIGVVPWTEIRLMEADHPPYESLETVLTRIGVDWLREAHPLVLLGEYMDHILAYYTYKFLLDRGFGLETNDNRGDGRFTLLFKRGDLVLRIEMDGEEEHIDFNGMPLADVYRTLGIEAHGFADMRKHIDAIVAWLDSTEVITVRG